MSKGQLLQQAQQYLDTLCAEIGERAVGSAGNRAATDFFASVLSNLGLETEETVFECLDWHEEGASLVVGGEAFKVFPSPYSLGVSVEAPLLTVESDEALGEAKMQGRILLLHGEVAAEPLMPKNFPFYNAERHQQIIRLLEEGEPAAIACVTARHPSLAGGAYPFPMIEDGDFDVPSVYMTDVEGARLLRHAGQIAVLESRARRVAAQGVNVVARKGRSERSGRRAVVCAHIDAKMGTPGAIDNGGGVVVLLLLAQLLAGYDGRLTIEIVALNGEDYYSVPGQQRYLGQNSGRLAEIGLAVNIDGAGYRKGNTAYSLYGLPPELAHVVKQVFEAGKGFVEGPTWYQGDHSMFVQNGVPAVAVTSEEVGELTTGITHTAKDRPEIVDCGKLVETARALYDLLRRVEGMVGATV